ncbi:MAG TPA: hypothetical protein PLK77_09745 [Pyrinomonadaceae bacterium]|nr:hypothetical protein [Pyrinomonadaceae bacterium]
MQTVSSSRKNKHFILNQKKLDKAKKILGAATETETVEIALERIISEAEANKKARAAHDKFVKAMVEGGHEIIDVYGNLD